MTKVSITYQVLAGNSENASNLRHFEKELNDAAAKGFAVVQMVNDRSRITAVMERLVNADES